jgi:hypothetical protein
LDIDGNNNCDALTDGLVIIRHLFGFRNDTLISSAYDPAGSRTTSADIEVYISNGLTMLDIDGNGESDALTDGLLTIRYLFGFSGTTLTSGATDPTGSRNTPTAVIDYLNALSCQ